MTQTDTTYPHYAAAYAAQQANEVTAIREMRERGWEAFNRIGLPTARRGNESWKYTNAGPIAREAFSYADLAFCGETAPTEAEVQSVAPWQPDWRTLVVVDGAFAPGLSTGTSAGAGITAGLADAVESDPELAERVLGHLVTPDEDGFAALNTAFVGDGIGVSVPAGADAGTINVVYLTTGRDQPRATHPRLVISAGPNSRATVIETFVGPDARYLTNTAMEASVGEGANVEHYSSTSRGTGSLPCRREPSFATKGLHVLVGCHRPGRRDWQERFRRHPRRHRGRVRAQRAVPHHRKPTHRQLHQHRSRGTLRNQPAFLQGHPGRTLAGRVRRQCHRAQGRAKDRTLSRPTRTCSCPRKPR